MARNGSGDNPERASSSATSSSSNIRLRSRADPFLIVCSCFSVITSLTAILCIAVNVLSAIRSFKNGSNIFDGIFRCYAVVIGLFVVVAETEWSFILKFWKVLEYWAGRGMLQILPSKLSPRASKSSGPTLLTKVLLPWWHQALLVWDFTLVAVMTQAFPDTTSSETELVLLQTISSYMLLGCGVVYVISGILCIGFLKRSRQQKEMTKGQAVRDLEELEQRRQELEALLLEEGG